MRPPHNARTLRRTPRLICLSLGNAKNRSAWFCHNERMGVRCACQVEVDRPDARAIPRERHCVAPAGTLCTVRTIVASIRASSIVRGAPDRGASCKPSIRCSAKRRRHLPAVSTVTPSAAASTTRPWRRGLHGLAPWRQRRQFRQAAGL